jgi:hypothetical protein
MGFAMCHHGESGTDALYGSVLPDITETQIGPEKDHAGRADRCFYRSRPTRALGGVGAHTPGVRVIPRGHQSPLAGLERAPEPVDPERYLRPEEVERLIVLARVVDRRWRRLPALIRLACVSGLRRGNLTALRCPVTSRPS